MREHSAGWSTICGCLAHRHGTPACRYEADSVARTGLAMVVDSFGRSRTQKASRSNGPGQRCGHFALTRSVCSKWPGTCSRTPSTSRRRRQDRGPLHSSGFQAVLCVRDTGRGISPEAVPTSSSAMAGGSTRPRRQGLGLGLAIAHRIVELHTEASKRQATARAEDPCSQCACLLPSNSRYRTEPGEWLRDFEPLARQVHASSMQPQPLRSGSGLALGASPTLQVLDMATPLKSANSDYTEHRANSAGRGS